jgi:hypothetical protein
MTGPRIPTLHPHRRRARLLLPFAAAIVLGQLACSSDQPTEPMSSLQAGPVVAATGSHPRPKLANGRMATTSTSVAPKASYSLAIAQASSGTGPSVLILADTDVVATSALATSLANAGLQVTVRPAPEYTWDGTNPTLSGFNAVVHLNGATYDFALSPAAQSALTSFVQNGGGFVGAQWNGYESQLDMTDLKLQGLGGDPSGPENNCAACNVTYQRLLAGEGHPVLEGLPASFNFKADAHDAGPAAAFATPLMEVSSGGPAVLVRQFGAGRVVNFSFAPNYPFDDLGNFHDPVTLQDPNVQQLYLNAVQWAGTSGSGTAQPQTIIFSGPLADKVYGDAPFSISASASSDLPVNFTAAGNCAVLGTTVTITGAGSCTITAQQAGNESYLPAEDVAQSFNIQQATPVIQWTPASIAAGTPLGSAQLNATATGLGGVTLSGNFNYTPPAGTVLDAGTASLSVQFTPSNPNYTGASKSVTITVVSSALKFIGFLPPVSNLPVRNIAYAGRAIPIRFSLGGYRGLKVLKAGSPTSTPVACDGGAPESPVEENTPARNGLYAVGYQYTYVWSTSPSWAGTCRRLIVTLIDGSTHEALFRFVAPNGVAANRRLIRGR